MATREEILATIAEIDGKLSAGAERVAHGETSVNYSFPELRRRRAELKAELATIDRTARPVRHIRTYSTKGL